MNDDSRKQDAEGGSCNTRLQDEAGGSCNITIGEVSAMFQVSTRMLRYYEKAGLIKSTRKEGYAYRVYDIANVKKVQQVIILRKLQIPLKQIRVMMDGSKDEAIRILEARISEISESGQSIQIIKNGLERLLALFREDASDKSHMDFVRENTLVELTELLPLGKNHLKKERKMGIGKEMVEKGSSVRILMLPPCTVAAYQFTGDNPEEKVGGVMDEFVRSSKLYEKKPDSRMFGFNHPDPEPDKDYHGYEVWVTIPEDMEVPAPLVKKHFDGGLYAAFTINFPEFQEWKFLTEWVENSEIYQPDYHDKELKDMGGCLEEHLNWVYSSHLGWPENNVSDGKLDLLLPIKAR